MNASKSRVPDWQGEAVPASQHNVEQIYVGKETLKRLWPLVRKDLLSDTGRCILEGCLSISAASATLEQLVAAPTACGDADMLPGSPLQRQLTLGGVPLQPPFEAVSEKEEPSDQHLAVLQSRIAAGEAPALTRRGVALAADLLERAKAWAWASAGDRPGLARGIQHVLTYEIVMEKNMRDVEGPAKPERHGGTSSRHRSSGSKHDRSSRRRGRSHSREPGDRNKRHRGVGGRHFRSRSPGQGRSHKRREGSSAQAHTNGAQQAANSAAQAAVSGAGLAAGGRTVSQGAEAPGTPSQSPAQQRPQTMCAQLRQSAAAQPAPVEPAVAIPPPVLADHDLSTGEWLAQAPPCMRLTGGADSSEPLDHMLEYLEGWGQAAQEDESLDPGFDSSSGMQVWSGSLVWPALKVGGRAEECAACMTRFGGASANDRAGSSWVQRSGSGMAACGLGLLMFTDDEHLSSIPKLSTSSAVDISNCTEAWRQLAPHWEGSVLVIAGEAGVAPHAHQLLRPWVALAAALRIRKQAASVRLGLQIDGEDRCFRLLLLPPPRPTEPNESLATKLLEAMPQAERDSLQTHVATLKGKAAAQPSPQQPSGRQPQRGHMLAMLCIEPGTGGNPSCPEVAATSTAVPAAAAAVSATAAPAAQPFAPPSAATMQASSLPSPPPPPPAAAAPAASAALEEVAHHIADSPQAAARSSADQSAGTAPRHSPSKQPTAEILRGKLVLGSGVGQRVAALLQQQHCGDGGNVRTSPTAGAPSAHGAGPMQPVAGVAEAAQPAGAHAADAGAAPAVATAQHAEGGQRGQQGQPPGSVGAAAVPAEAAAATAGADAGAHAAEQLAAGPVQPEAPSNIVPQPQPLSLATQWAIEQHRQAVEHCYWAAAQALYSMYSQQYAAAAWHAAYQVPAAASRPMPAREDTAAFATASTAAAVPATAGETATLSTGMAPAAQPATFKKAYPVQDAGCLPYAAPECSGVKEALRNHALELQEAVVARLAGADDWVPTAELIAAVPLSPALQEQFRGGMLSFLKDGGCKPLVTGNDPAWTCVAARSGAVRRVRLRRRVLDLCYAGVSVSDQVVMARVRQRLSVAELLAKCKDLLAVEDISEAAFLELLSAELASHVEFVSFGGKDVFVEPLRPPPHRRCT